MSLELYKKAFGNVNVDVSTAYYYLGNYFYRIKNYNKALSYFQLSLIAGFPGFTSENILDNPEISKENLISMSQAKMRNGSPISIAKSESFESRSAEIYVERKALMTTCPHIP